MNKDHAIVKKKRKHFSINIAWPIEIKDLGGEKNMILKSCDF